MTVFAFVSGTTQDDTVLAYATWATKALAEPLTIVVQAEATGPEVPSGIDFYEQMDIGEGVFREITARTRETIVPTDHAAIELAQSAARRAKEAGVERVRTIASTDDPKTFAEHSTDSGDLLVLPRTDVDDRATQRWMNLLKADRRILLMVPEQFAAPSCWMAAIDGRTAAGRAVDYLSRHQLLRSIPGVAAMVGDDYRGRMHFRDAVKHLQDVGYRITPYELQGNPEDVLATVIAVLPVDFLILGARDQGRLRMLLEGSTVAHLMRMFKGPILIARE